MPPSRMPRGSIRSVAWLLVLVLATSGLLTGTASAAASVDAEWRMVYAINTDRTAAGLPPLRVDAELQRVARDWTGAMVREDRLYHNPYLETQVRRDWVRLAENVAWWPATGASQAELVARTHAAIMASPEHRARVLDPEFEWVGVGVEVTKQGKLWATVTFMHGTGAPPPLGPGDFRDVNGGVHSWSIRAIALRGVTRGCTTEQYCPSAGVTRAQMASFIARARGLSPVGGDHFTDVAGSPHRGAINALAAAGIAGGCGHGRFCPDAPVSRAQMATFLRRAWGLPVTSSAQRFVDVAPSLVHYRAVTAVAEAGITNGCAAGRYCPNQGVRRAEMASFLARTLGLQ